MGPRRIIVLLIALVAAGGTAMYARSWVAGQQNVTVVQAPVSKAEIYEVLVADSDLPAGTFISRGICAGSNGPPTMCPTAMS